jgi:hypothetical protein
LQTPIPQSYHQASRDHSPPFATSWRCHARTRMPRPQPHSAERPTTTPPTSHIPPHTNNNHFATAFSLTSTFRVRLAAHSSTMRPRAQSAPRRSVAGSHSGGHQSCLSHHHQPNFLLLLSNNSQSSAHLLLAIKHLALTNSRQQVGRTSRVLRRAPLSQMSTLAFRRLTRTLWLTLRLRLHSSKLVPFHAVNRTFTYFSQVASARGNVSQNHCFLWSAPAVCKANLVSEGSNGFLTTACLKQRWDSALGVSLLRGLARQCHLVVRLNLSEAKWTPKIKHLLRPKPTHATCLSTLIDVGRLEEAFMLTDPLRRADFVEGQEWKGHFLTSPSPSPSIFPACLSLPLTPLCRHGFRFFH